MDIHRIPANDVPACSAPGCTRAIEVKGLCRPHYKRVRRGLSPDPLGPLLETYPTTCTVEGCDGKIRAKGLCNNHYARVKHHGTTELSRVSHAADPCSVDGCRHLVGAKGSHGYCSPHAHRFTKYGDPLAGKREYGTPDEEYFWSKVDKSGECWIWTGNIDPNGYGRFSQTSKTNKHGRPTQIAAHRFAFDSWYGRTPLSELNHLCYRRSCVKPDHLEETTKEAHIAHGNARRESERAAYRLLEPWFLGLCKYVINGD